MGCGASTPEQKLCSDVAKAGPADWKQAFVSLTEYKHQPNNLQKVSSNKKVWNLVQDIAQRLDANSSDYEILMKGISIFLRTNNFYYSIKNNKADTIGPILKGTCSSNPLVAVASLDALSNALSYNVMDFKNNSRAPAYQTKARSTFFETKGSESLVKSLQYYATQVNKHNRDLKPDSKMPAELPKLHMAVIMCLKVISQILLDPKDSTMLKDVIELRRLLGAQQDHVFELLRCVDWRVRYHSARMLIGMVLTSDENQSVKSLQDRALVQGIALWIMYLSITRDEKDTTHKDYYEEKVVKIFRTLFGVLYDGNKKMKNFVKEILPRALVSQASYKMKEDLLKSFPFAFTAKTKAGVGDGQIRWDNYAGSRGRLGAVDWNLVMQRLDQKAERPKLIWNKETKATLLDSLLLEIKEFEVQKKLMGSLWDYDGFEVLYPHLLEEYEVGGIYLRLLLTDMEGKQAHPLQEDEAVQFMNEMFIKATVELDRDKKLALVKTMSLVFNKFQNKFTNWTQVPYLVSIMQQNTDPQMRDLVVSFLLQVLKFSPNVTSFVKSNGIQTLVKNMIAIHTFSEEKEKSEKKNSEGKSKAAAESKDFFTEFAARFDNTLNTGELALEAVKLLRQIFKTKPQYMKVIPRRFPGLIVHLIQMMFVKNSEILKISQEILVDLIAKNARLKPTLAKTGIFIFALAALSEPEKLYPAITTIVFNSHMLQKSPYATENNTVLAPYLPPPFYQKLKLCKDAKAFREKLTSTSYTPSYIWTKTQIKELTSQVGKYVAPLEEALKRNSSTEFKYDQKIHNMPVEYKSLENELCVGNVYLRLLFLPESKEYKLENPKLLAKQMMEYMPVMVERLNESKFSPNSIEHCQTLIKAQDLLIKEYRKQSIVLNEYKAFTSLLAIMSMDKAGRKTQDLAGSLVISLLHMEGRRLSHQTIQGTEATSPNVKKCVQAGGCKILINHFVHLVEKKADDILKEDALKALTIISKNAQEDMCNVVVKSDYKFLSCVARLMDFLEPTKLLKQCLILLEAFFETKNRDMPKHLVESGIVLRIVRVAVQCKATQTNPPARVALSAVDLIRKAISTNSIQEQKSKVLVRKLINSLLTSGIYLMLQYEKKGVEAVAKTLRSDVETPTILWNGKIRKELDNFFEKEEKNVVGYKKWEFTDDFKYSTLRYEPVWDNVYLRLYAKEELSYRLPEYLGISNQEFYHSLLKMLVVFGREKGLLFEKPKAGEEKGETSVVSSSMRIPIPENSKPTDHMAVLARCVLHTLKSDEKLHEDGSSGLYDLFQLLVHEHPKLQDAVLQTIECCNNQPDSMQTVLTAMNWILCMIHSSERSSYNKVPTLDTALSAVATIVTSGAWNSELDPPPGAQTLEEIETLLCNYGFPVLLARIIVDKKQYTKAQRLAAAKMCGEMSEMKNSKTRQTLSTLLSWQVYKLLPKCSAQPELLLEFFDTIDFNPRVYWTEEVQAEAVKAVVKETNALLEWQDAALASGRTKGAEHKPCNWDYKTLKERVKLPTLEKQLCVGEIFVYQLENFPHFRVDPKVYLPPLWEALAVESKKIRFGDAEEKAIKDHVSMLTSFGIVVRNLPRVASDLKPERLQEIYGYLNMEVDPITENTLQVLAMCAKETAIKSAMHGLIRLIVPILMQGSEKNTMNVLEILIKMVRQSSPVVKQILELGCHLILILICFGEVKGSTKKVKVEAANLIGAMVNDGPNGFTASDEFCKILTGRFSKLFEAKADIFLGQLTKDHEHKGREWNSSNRNKIKDLLKLEIDELVPRMSKWRQGQILFDNSKLDKIWPPPPEPEAGLNGLPRPEEKKVEQETATDEKKDEPPKATTEAGE